MVDAGVCSLSLFAWDCPTFDTESPASLTTLPHPRQIRQGGHQTAMESNRASTYFERRKKTKPVG